MSFSRQEIEDALRRWNLSWDKHNLDGVIQLFHDEIVFENWTAGKASGKIIRKLTYSKTTIDIGGERLPLSV